MVLALTGSVASGASAWAQQSTAKRDDAQSDALEEVVVTARGREEDLQQVPISMTVLSSVDIISRSIVDVRDVVSFTPSMTFYSGTGRGDPTALVVRGVSPQTSDERYQGLSVFIDGIPISGQVTGVDLSQVERVEIMKGPQSAKYGRATYSGAIDYVTKVPQGDKVTASLRSRYSQHGSGSAGTTFYTGNVTVPVVADRLWVSANATFNRVGGRYPNRGIDGGRVGQEQTDSYGGTVFAKPWEGSTLKLRYAQDAESDSPALFTVTQPTDWAGQPYNLSNLYTITAVNPITPGCPTACSGIGSVWINGDVPNVGAGLTGTDFTGAFPRGFLPAAYPDGGGATRRRQFASLLFTQDLAGLELSYRAGYFEQAFYNAGDFRYRAAVGDPTFGPLGVTGGTKVGFNVANEEVFRNQSHQIRIASAGADRFRWSAGLFYFDESDRNRQVIAPTSVTNPGAPVTRQTRGLERLKNQAIFGDIAYDFSDRLTGTLEGRFQEETVYFDACPQFVANAVPAQTGLVCSFDNPLDRSAKNSDFTPRVTLQYALTDDINAYAYWSKGVKSGRFNTSAAAFNFAFIEPEELDNIELGLKSVLFDQRLVLNVALFSQTITGQQLLVTVPNPLCIFNPTTGAITSCPPGQMLTLTGVQAVGDSEVYGAEIEGRWQVTERFSTTYGIGYAHHEFSDAVGPFRNTDPQFFLPGETLKGKTSINTPRVTGNLSGEYRMPLVSGRFELALRADALYTGRRYLDLANRASLEPVTRFNARATLTGGDGKWNASIFGRDLTDEATPLGGGLTGSSSCYFTEAPLPPAVRPGQRCQSVGLPRGREIGLELSYSF
jgi:outer membrane receptor protein involved in Fe transport